MDVKKTCILLAEDDDNIGSLLRDYLAAKGYSVDWYADGESATKYFDVKKYDLCILDVMMPKKDGFTAAKEIRKRNEYIPIIFLTAKSMKDDLSEGFASGADDYMTKPFSTEELLWRIEAILRRTRNAHSADVPEDQSVFTIGNFTFDFTKQTLSNNKGTAMLTTKEAQLLQLLCIHQNQVLDRNYALGKVWAEENYFNARSMDVYITKLRKFLKSDPSISIVNVRGQGFKLVF
jgi:DNA-binding response OmpR family regulator